MSCKRTSRDVFVSEFTTDVVVTYNKEGMKNASERISYFSTDQDSRSFPAFGTGYM